MASRKLSLVADPKGSDGRLPLAPAPDLQTIYDSIPIGLAFLTPDCRYLQINPRMTEICGIPVADHLGRSVRETLPRLADAVENLVRQVVATGEPVSGIEISGERPDESGATRFWLTSWQPLKGDDGKVLGVNVAAEEITQRKRAEAALIAAEVRFRELADNISQFAWTADPTGSRYWYNNRWFDYSGTTLEEMWGFGWQKLHHPDHLQRVLALQRHCFATGTPWEDTFPLRGRDGQYRWFLSRALPIRDEHGAIVRWFGTNTDVTEQVQAERALRELNETLEQRVEAQARERNRIWNVSHELLLVADAQGRFLSVNPAWLSTLGWSESELIGQTSEWLVHPDDAERSRADLARLAAGPATLTFESRFRRKDGSYRWLSWTSVRDGELIYAVARDTTDLKEAEEAARASRQELARVARDTTLGAMTASIAHEINQPLAAIATNGNAGVRWLTNPTPDLGEVRASLKRIVDDAHRASQIIASVRSMFRKDEGELAPLDISNLVREVLVLVQGELQSQRVLLETSLHEGLPLIYANRVQLQQVVLNLVINAIEAMSSVADRPRILLVKCETYETESVLLTVQDSGTGIEAKEGDRIFDAFFTTKPTGLGMGLAICRSIVEAHGGRLWASPGSPHGAVFHLSLPAGTLG